MTAQQSTHTKTDKWRFSIKAYMVFPGITPSDMGCTLIYAYTVTQARVMGLADCPLPDVKYIDIKARRVYGFDKYALSNDPYIVSSNDQLPEGVEFYEQTI